MKRLQAQTAIFLVSVQAVAVMCFEQSDFKLVTNMSVGISQLSNDWQSDSPLSCAVNCITTGPECRCFIYNKQTQLCTLGRNLVFVKSTKRDLSREHLYSLTICREGQGFVWHININGSLCLWLSPPGDIRNYTDADNFCRAKGLKLITMKTVQKWFLFLDAIGKNNINDNFWIGLTDQETEDKFRWTDDGSQLSASVRRILFNKNEPKNFNDLEDCVEYSVTINPCNDCNCSGMRRYMCEDTRDVD